MISIANPEDMALQAERFVGSLSRRERATVVTLSGDLGAGKTTFTQGLARALGVEDTVTSPTFVIEKAYELQGKAWERLIHIDAYRLNGEHDLAVLGWDEMVQDGGNLIVLEWPEKVAGAIPTDAVRISFEHQGDARIMNLNGSEESDKKDR